jgi:catechol 2,3-dioxygenase-like lactoylglutathione lyase family enzyme
MLKITGIDHLNLEVIDLEESSEFWEKLFGFKTLEEIKEQNGRIIGNRYALLALYETPGMKKYEKVGFSHVSFHVENFDEVEQKCIELGIPVKYNGPITWPKSKSIYIEDPNGYEIELAEHWGGKLVDTNDSNRS